VRDLNRHNRCAKAKFSEAPSAGFLQKNWRRRTYRCTIEALGDELMRPLHALLIVGAASLFSSGALAADAAKGGELARRACAICHLVAADQERVPTVAPPFATIGKKAGFDARQLTQAMQPPHPQMPTLKLSPEQAEDVAAYVQTLK
jgi:mono/diheme cytochrome c family protein